MLRVKQVHYICGIAQEKTFELAAVELLDIKLVIGCIYRSPKSDIEEFLNKFEIVIQNHNKRLIMCGDWNVNLCQNNSNLFKLLGVLEMYNLTKRITAPTRITKTSCSLIDVWEHPTYHHACYPITFWSSFLQRSTANQIQLLFPDQSALTAAATGLGSVPPRFV
jgi:hypothetical protein